MKYLVGVDAETTICTRYEARLTAIAVLDRAYYLNATPSHADRANYSRRQDHLERIRSRLFAELSRVRQPKSSNLVTCRENPCYENRTDAYRELASEIPVGGGCRELHDVTKHKLGKQELPQAQFNRAHVTRLVTMAEMVASIAHEVSQPLTAILMTSKCALREMEGGAPNVKAVQEAIKEIAEDGTRMSEIISRIRAFVKKEPLDQAELNISCVIQEAALLLSQEATRNDVQVQLDLASDLPGVLGDRVQLQQVLINLAMNAIDAMRPVVGRPRELVIRLASHGNGVLIQVQDSGIGLNADWIDRIFEPFFTTKPQGMGMGLSISRSIIELHGGRLWAEPGSDGAIFQVILPNNRNRVA